MFSQKARKGFTMVEMAIVIAVIVIVSVVVYANYNEINDAGEIITVADKMREDVRLAQNFSLTGRANRGKVANGWGIYFNRNTSRYIVFSDLNNDKVYDYPTRLLIHGAESISSNAFTESSKFAKTASLGGGNASYAPSQQMGAGKPIGNGYWDFDGINDFISIPNNQGTDKDIVFRTGDFTIDTWIYPRGTGSRYSILESGVGTGLTDRDWTLVRDSDNLIKFTFYDNGSGSYVIQSNSSVEAINANTWYHVAVTRNKDFITLFINGVPHDTLSIGAGVQNRFMSGNIYVGSNAGASGDYFNGDIDEIRIVQGWANWYDNFSNKLPTNQYDSDEEKYREVKLPPGVVLERLFQDYSPVSELNAYFNPKDYWLYLNNNSGNEEGKIVVNRAGMEGTGLAGDTPRAYLLGRSGLISLTK